MVLSCNQDDTVEDKTTSLLVDTVVVTNNYETISENIKQQPNNADLFYQRALILFQENDIDRAFGDIDRALAIDSLNANYYLLKADLFYKQKQTIPAREVLSKCLKLIPDNIEVNIKLAEIYLLLQNYNRTINYANNALRVDVHYAQAYFIKGLCFKYLKDTAKAVSNFQTAVEQDNNYYDAYMQLGLLYAKAHNELALGYFDNAIRIQPKSIEAIYGKALFLQNHGNPQKAIEGYALIKKIDANNYNAYFNSGYIYLELIKDYNKAIAEYSILLGLYPTSYQGFYNRALAYVELNQLDKAIADLKSALKIQPDYELAARELSRLID